MNRKKQIWILEDNQDSLYIYREILDFRYDLTVAKSISQFNQKIAARETADLLIADLRLPDGNFVEFLKQGCFAATSFFIPFIIVSSIDDLDVLRECFRFGAADYLTKPFTRNELIVKLENYFKKLERRVEKRAGQSSVFPVVFEPEALIVRRPSGCSIQLTAREMRVFSALYGRDGEPIPRNELIQRVWRECSVSEKTLDVHIFNLRKKLALLGLGIVASPSDHFYLSCDHSVV